MGCCGGGGSSKRTVRKQIIDRPAKASKKAVVVQRIRKSSAPSGQKKRITVARQHIVPRQKCHACGFPTMAVDIAGRERLQCSNPNCRIIIR